MSQRRTLVTLAASYALSFASGGIQLPLTSLAMKNVGIPMSSIGIMWATRSVLGIIGPIIWGVLADRKGDARPFTIAALFSGAGLLMILARTTDAARAILIFGLYGLLCGPVGSLLDGMVITALGQERHHHFGKWRMWGTLGFGVTACGSALLIDAGLLEAIPSLLFPICAGLTASGALVLFFVPKLPRPALGRVKDIWPVLKRPDMIALFLTSTLLWCSHVAYSSFITPLAEAAGLPEWSVGISLAAAIVVEAVMLTHSSFFLVRFSGRNVIIGICALTTIRWGLTAFTVSPTIFILMNALHGITFGLFFATLVAQIASRVPAEMRQSTQGGIGSSSFGVGGALGALLTGTVLEHYDARTTWLAMSAVAAVALVVAWRLLKGNVPTA